MIYRKYLLKTYLRSFLLAFGSFASLYTLGEFLDRIDNFIEAKAGVGLYLTYLGNFIPIISITITPLAILLASFMTIGHFERSNELTAMRAGGISLKKIVSPIVVVALITTFAIFFINEFSVPYNRQEVKRINNFELRGKDHKQITKEIWLRDAASIANIGLYDPRSEYIEDILITTLDQATGKIRMSQTATSAYYQHADSSWSADNLIIRTFNNNAELTSFNKEKSGTLQLTKQPRDFEQLEGRAEELSLRRLFEVVDELKLSGAPPLHHLVEIHSRFAAPFTCLIMALIGIPFALQKGRKSSLGMGVGISIAIGIIFQIITSVLLAYGKTGIIPPLLAAWGGNILFFILAIQLLRSNNK